MVWLESIFFLWEHVIKHFQDEVGECLHFLGSSPNNKVAMNKLIKVERCYYIDLSWQKQGHGFIVKSKY